MSFLAKDFFVEPSRCARDSIFFLPIEEDTHFFLAYSNDQTLLGLIKEIATNTASSLELSSLLSEIANYQEDWHKTKLILAICDLKKDELASFNLNSPQILCKEKDGAITKIGTKTTTIDASSLKIDGFLASDISTLFITQDSYLASIIENHLPYLYSKKEIIESLNKFANDLTASELDFVFVNSEINRYKKFTQEDTIDSTITAISNYEQKLESILEEHFSEDIVTTTNTSLIFTELVMNAFEHGNLNISPEAKQQLIASGEYDDFVTKKEQETDKKIKISVTVYPKDILKITITDEGDGFDFEKYLNKLNHSDSSAFRGRGVIMSRQTSIALFYSDGGRSVTYFMRFTSDELGSEDIAVDDESLLKSLTILYVEDDNFIRTHLSHLIKRLTGNLLLAKDGQEGLLLFDQYKPDIVITDVEMPIMDGLTLSENIRKVSRDIPIIVTTAYNTEEFFIRAIDAGIDKFIIKPIRFPVLKKALFDFSRAVYLKNQAKEQLIARNLRQESMLEELSERELYTRTQEEAVLKKQHLVTTDHREKISSISASVFYKPIEILSGDVYGIVDLEENRSLIFIVDSMGKGLSASVTAILSAAFISRSAKLGTANKNFTLNRLVYDYINYIKNYLLDDEYLSFVAIMVDGDEMEFSSFGSPSIYLNRDEKAIKLQPQNPPITKHIDNIRSEKISLAGSKFVVLYSNGITSCKNFDKDEFEELVATKQNSNDLVDEIREIENRASVATEDITLIAFEVKSS